MDDTEIHNHSTASNLPARASSTSLSKSQQTWRAALKPASPGEAVALLTTCLALVKPVGMSDADAQAWLTVAAGEVRDLPMDILADACADARKSCSHHAQIIPAILKSCEERMRQRKALAGIATVPEGRRLPQPDRWKPTADELEAIKRDAAAKLSADRRP